MNRPLAWAAVPFLSGIAVSVSVESPDILGACAALIGFALIGFLSRRERVSRFGVVLLFAGAGTLYATARTDDPNDDELLREALESPHHQREIEGSVARTDIVMEDSEYAQFTVHAERVRRIGTDTWRQVDSKLLVRLSMPAHPLFAGERVRVSGRVDSRLSEVNPNTSSYEDYLRRRGVQTQIRVRGEEVRRVGKASSWSILHWASRLRHAQAERLGKVVPEDILPFVYTVWLGERRLIGHDTYDRFIASGTAHILAVSGVHTAVVFLTTAFVLQLLLRDYRYRRIRGALVILAVFVFAIVAGGRISSLRAATMFALYVGAELLDRDSDAPTALSAAALLFTLHNPFVIFDPGFILSFLSIASILVFNGPIADLLGEWPWRLQHSVAVPVSVQILPLPAATSFFYVVPLLGAVSNLFVVPLLSIALWLTLITSVLAFLYAPVAELFAGALWLIVNAILFFVESVASLESASIDVSPPSIPALCAYGVAVGGLYGTLTRPEWRRYSGAGTVAALVFAIALWNHYPQRDEIVFLDVGQGDSAVVRTVQGGTLVVDGGNRSVYVDHGKRTVAPFLRSHGIRQIDGLVATHSDSDHIGGLIYLLEKFRVGTVYLGPVARNAALEQQFIQAAREQSVPVIRVQAGDPIELPGAQVEVVHPEAEWARAADDNNASVVLRITIGHTSFLLTGDIEARAEAALPPRALDADVLKVPHHGSRTSSTADFIRAVSPRLAVIPVGPRGRDRILSHTVINAYQDAQVPVLRTDYGGGVRIRLLESGIAIETGRGLRNFPHPERDLYRDIGTL